MRHLLTAALVMPILLIAATPASAQTDETFAVKLAASARSRQLVEVKAPAITHTQLVVWINGRKVIDTRNPDIITCGYLRDGKVRVEVRPPCGGNPDVFSISVRNRLRREVRVLVRWVD